MCAMQGLAVRSTANGSAQGVPKYHYQCHAPLEFCTRDHAWRAERGSHSHVSFAIEPIQPPIVPLSLFS